MTKLILHLCMAGTLLVGADRGDRGACGAGGDRGAGGEKKTSPKSADGTWIVVGMERNGKKVPDDVVKKLDMKLTIKGEHFTVTAGGEVSDRGTTKVDFTKNPPALESKPTEGANQGKTILGIRQVEGDTMKACYDLEGKKRPTEFATKEGSGHILILYRRAKTEK